MTYTLVTDDYGRAVERALGGLPARLVLARDGRSGRYVVVRKGNNYPFLWLDRDRKPVSWIKNKAHEIFHKSLAGEIRPNEETPESIKRAIDEEIDRRGEDTRRALHAVKDDYLSEMRRDSTDGKGPNGGSKFFGPLMDR